MSMLNVKMTSSTPAGKAGTALTMHDLKAYVGDSTKDRSQQQGFNNDTVLLDMTHNYLKNQYLEIPFSRSWNLEQTKNKVYQTFGTSPEWQEISIAGNKITDETKTLGDLGVASGMILHCHDANPHSEAKGGGYEDVSLVEKFELTDEQYDKMENTYRAFKRRMIAKDPNWIPKHVAEARARKLAANGPPVPPEAEEEVYMRMQVGMRCEAIGGRRGVIRWIGKAEELKTEHTYIGVEFDEPEGKHDGIIGEKRYFQTPPNQGAFLPSTKVKAGKEFVEVDPFASDDDEEDMDEEL